MTDRTKIERRLEAERRFHNERFAEEVRGSVQGFYRAISECFSEYDRVVASRGLNKTVIEYGCGKGETTLKRAEACAFVHGIDISDVAIQNARAVATSRRIENVRFDVMNAENLTLEDASFDLAYGSGIIHHLDIEKAYAELHRVLKAGGVAVFIEPLGHNPFINCFRKRTPELRTPDEHPMLKSDLQAASKYFYRVDVRLFGLATLCAIPFLKTGVAESLIKAGQVIDKVLLRIPGLKWWAWYSLLEFHKSEGE